MTGRYPIHTGRQSKALMPEQPDGLSTEFTLMPEYLKRLGYHTHMVGKWHLGFCNESYLPTRYIHYPYGPCATDIILHLGLIRRGFDKFDGYWIGSEDYFKHTRRSRTYPKVAGFDFHHNEDPDFRFIGKYSTGVFADKATAIIRRASTKSSPLFLYLAFQAPHSPLQVEEIEKENCKRTQESR